ncbi:hypothetical protein BJX99DRAFT_246402 [Aspergillus californicus]
MIACAYPGCTAQYRRKEHLTRHARKHGPAAQQLTCDRCHKAFDRTDTLRRHQLLHRREGERSIPRTAKACDQCHLSKTRCDGGTPCNVCSRRSVECTFFRESKKAPVRPGSTGEGQDEETDQDLLSFNQIYERIEREALVGQIDSPELSNILSGGQPDMPVPEEQATPRLVEDRGQSIKHLLLKHEDDLRDQGLLNSPDATPKALPLKSPQPLDIEHYTEVYFENFHHHWPILHRPSFRRSQEPQILRLTVAMIGLWVTGEKASRVRAESMHEKLLQLLENRMADWKLEREFKDKSWPMTTYQGIILNVVFAMIREVPLDLYDRCLSLLHALTSTCLTGGLFSYKTMQAQQSPTDSLLFLWTYIDEMKRLALAIFKVNVFFKTGTLTAADLKFPMPGDGYLWDAPLTRDFYRRYNAQHESGIDQAPYVCDVFRDVQEGRRGMGLLMGMDMSLLMQRPNHNHGRCSHHHGNWLHGMDTWGTLEALQALLCQRDPSRPLSSDLLNDIDMVISHRNTHRLLTSSSSISPRLVIKHDEGRQTRVSIWKGDITALTDVTAVVNAANSQMLGCFHPSHRCIDNVIHSAAGPRLRQACYELMIEQGHDEPVGRAKVTPGFNLPAPYVIHTVGPELRSGQAPDARHRQELSECYVSCLEAAESLPVSDDGRKVLGFCCISTGLFAFPSEIAAGIALETVYKWCLNHPETTITDIIFDTFLQRDYDLYNERISSLQLPVDSDSDSAHRVTITRTTPSLPEPILSPAIKTARAWLQQADYLIISAGAGLSASTGLDYTSPALFAKHFPAFLPLGLRRLYDVFGFEGWESPAQKWGYYFHHLNMVRTWPVSPVYASLRQIATRFGSRCFVRTSNADGFFLANRFHPGRISTPQGSYAYLQCFAKCRREAVFPSGPFLDAAIPWLDPVTQWLTDGSKIPMCRYCGGELTLCVRGGDYFNDSPFRSQEREYGRFVERVEAMSENREDGNIGDDGPARAVILELGVGLNTPSVLRWPNEELVMESRRGFRLIRAGFDAAGCVPWELEEEGVAVGIERGLDAVVEMLLGTTDK